VQVMETFQAKLEGDHPDTLTSMAFTWKGQGKDAEALQLMEYCVQRRKRVLGVQHPHFLSSHTTLCNRKLSSRMLGTSWTKFSEMDFHHD
jgi:tetratricopeptide repeat protein